MLKPLTIMSKTLLRSKRNAISFGVLCIVTFFIILRLHKTEFSAVDFLTSSLGVGICGFIYFSFISYENAIDLRRVGGQECLAVFKNSELNLRIAQLLVWGVPLIVWSLIIFIWQLVDCYSRGISFLPYTWHCLSAVLLYCTCPSYIGLLLGLCLEKIRRPIASGIILAITLLSSNLLSAVFSGNILFGISLASIFDWFAISVPNSAWFADSFYGIPMERCRWALVILWVFAIAGLFLLQVIKKCKKAIVYFACGCFIISFVCGMIFSFREKDCVVIKDYRPGGMLTGDQDYYSRQNEHEMIQSSADFFISQYDLYVEVANTMTVTAKIETTGNSPNYQFTLYHGYQIESVESENGTAIPYERTGDYIDIYPTDSSSAFIIRYSGSGGKYYANNQGICLPGYFAWYPFPGYQSVWDYDSGTFYVNTGNFETNFNININYNKKVFSNISEDKNNSFSGSSDSVSLYAGLIKEISINGIRYIYSPLNGQLSEINLDEIMNVWLRICETIGVTQALSLTDKCIIFQPLTIVSTSSSQLEQAVIMQNQILLCNFNPTEEDICFAALRGMIPEDKDTLLLRSAFFEELLSDENTSNITQKPDYAKLRILKRYSSANEIVDMDDWYDYSEAESIFFGELFEYQLQNCGKNYVFSKVYQYLISDVHAVDQVDFLYYMDGVSND